VTSRFDRFELDLSALRYPPVSEELWIQHLRTGQVVSLVLGGGGVEERRLEDYVVSGLIDFDDVSYDDHADLLYELAGQVVRHLRTYLSEEDAAKVLRYYQRDIARLVHVQMLPHFSEAASGGYEVVVSRGMTPLKESAYTELAMNGRRDFRVSVTPLSDTVKYVFGGFSRCLYELQKFHSDPERQFAVILERDAVKWMKPAKGQFQIHYTSGTGQTEYQPDFVAETDTQILLTEVKARNQLEDAEVLAKKQVAVEWCKHATTFSEQHGGKPWQYVLLPHDAIADNIGLQWLVDRFGGAVSPTL
jgi:type III restriction enzyme